MVFGFGNTDNLQHEKKYFEFGFANDNYKYKKVACYVKKNDRAIN